MSEPTLVLRPAAPYDFDLTAGYLAYFVGRYAADTFEDGTFRRLLDLGNRLALAVVRSSGTTESPALEVELKGVDLGPMDVAEAGRQVAWMLDVVDDLTSFYRMAHGYPPLDGLVHGLHGLHVPHTPSVFEALVLAILGQQISTHVARMLRTLLIQTYGSSVEVDGATYYAFPRPETLADAGVSGLRGIKFSGRKAEYVVSIARLVASRELELEDLRNRTTEEVIQTLTAIRGVGMWTAHWLLIRALGHGDGFPHGDLALQRSLGLLVNGGVPVDPQDALEYSQRWSPYRSYATTYLFASARLGRLEANAAAGA